MDFLVKNLRFLSATRGQAGQSGAGTTAGVGQPAISKIINGGTKQPGYTTVMGLARHFGVSMDDLVSRDLELEGDSRPSQPVGLDSGKLAALIETVEAAVAQSRRAVPPRLKAKMIAALYAHDPELAASTPQTVQALLASILTMVEDEPIAT
ncbi:helix-turn-helix transcriptional regulator [Stenotrophomonas sp. SORGH_AS_0321]|uniref:helix-turn-helix transcriptional regulator n=1 Tax=Stenotrophomonas sp. SORGH_AS_0321 TaxID=3041787 RepID=UPI00285BDDAC|nr:helix-turn-helix transcriptional regulator [Stenotrophomonas sp. SORGH_AS_0321]MDR6094925.1 transcriptional regulator with XRE-family HTH domain [Stenotrophomonas sp. SORGH_AS_0321]